MSGRKLPPLHMVLKKWTSGLILKELKLNFTMFWIQIHGLPPSMQSTQILEANAKIIGEKIGRVIQIDVAGGSLPI